MIGVLMMAYGGPNTLEDVEPYLLDVRGYRETPQEIIDEVRERYHQIGGCSPILDLTYAQAKALEEQLNADDEAYKVYVGMRHWYPFIDRVLEDMAADGITQAVGLVMAPHYSKMSIGAYYKKVESAGADIEIAPIERWNLLPGYLDGLTDRIEAALQRFPDTVRDTLPIIFTAHSLPERILEWGDPYPQELQKTVEAITPRFESHPYEFAYQSAAISDDPWLGPDAGDVMKELTAKGHQHMLIVPIGFVCEHVEILYDIDIEYQTLAKTLGVRLERIGMLNSAPAMIAGLAERVREVVKEKQWA